MCTCAAHMYAHLLLISCREQDTEGEPDAARTLPAPDQILHAVPAIRRAGGLRGLLRRLLAGRNRTNGPALG